jgi:hypothetical protein
MGGVNDDCVAKTGGVGLGLVKVTIVPTARPTRSVYKNQ